jgi:hypothetical protein
MFRKCLSTSYQNEKYVVSQNFSSRRFGTKPSKIRINNTFTRYYNTQQQQKRQCYYYSYSFSSKMNPNNNISFIRRYYSYSRNNFQQYHSRIYHSSSSSSSLSFIVRNIYKNNKMVTSSRRTLIVFGLSGIGIGIGIGYYCCTLLANNNGNHTFSLYRLGIITTNNNTVTQCKQENEQPQDDDETASTSTITTTLETSSDMMLMDDDENDEYRNLYDTVNTMMSNVYYTYQIVLRCMKLLIVFTPVITLYPIYYYCAYYYRDSSSKNNNIVKRDAQDIVLGLDLNEKEINENDTTNNTTGNTVLSYHEQFIQYYYTICLHCVENSYSATIIKFMQWVSSRPDLFGIEFCNIFNKLQDHTKPHSDTYTKQCMENAYGVNWMENIQLYNVIGSGCIGQVYRGRIKIKKNNDTKKNSDTTTTTTNSITTKDDDHEYHDVAIKVIHPHIMNDIDTDLDILRYMIQCIQFIHPNIRKQCEYLNINGVINEFSKLLKLQFDLRYEAQNLLRFHTNFKNDTVIQFPQLFIYNYPPTHNVLIESFCDGIPILQFCRTNLFENNYNKHQLTKLCYHGIRAVCQMIFLDNFVHGTYYNISINVCSLLLFFFSVGCIFFFFGLYYKINIWMFT